MYKSEVEKLAQEAVFEAFGFEKQAISQAFVQRAMNNALAQGVDAKRMAGFAERRADAGERHLDKARAINTATATPEQLKQREFHLTQMDKNLDASSHGMNAMANEVSHLSGGKPLFPGVGATRDPSLMQRMGNMLPKSNMGRAALGAGVLAAGYGAYRALKPAQQQPQQQPASYSFR